MKSKPRNIHNPQNVPKWRALAREAMRKPQIRMHHLRDASEMFYIFTLESYLSSELMRKLGCSKDVKRECRKEWWDRESDKTRDV